MTRSWWIALAFLGGLTAAGCRTAQSGERPERPKAPAKDPYLIEADEIKATDRATNLYEVVRLQRPAWLTRTVRNSQGNEAIVVYLDERKYGNLDILRQLSVSAAKSLQFLTPTEALLRFGPTHGSVAAIVVEVAKN